jgi:hypothetical protein
MSERLDNSSVGSTLSLHESASKPSLYHLEQLLESYPDTIDEIESTILALQVAYPWMPPPQINAPDGPWPTTKPHYVHKSHIMTEAENIRIAIENIARTGRILDDAEKEFLRYILSFRSGWSAVSPGHHEDSWVHYIKHQFSHIENLHPILDDMTWPEEVKLFVDEYGPGYPGYLLFANTTSFYFYVYDGDYLLKAGNTLEQVYWGLRQRRWIGLDDSEEMWVMELDNGEEYDHYDYFPVWKGGVDENGRKSHVLSYPLLPFVPHVSMDFGEDSGCNSEDASDILNQGL